MNTQKPSFNSSPAFGTAESVCGGITDITSGIVTADHLPGVTDLFAPAPTLAPVPAAPVEYATDEMQIAVALICNGYGEPELREVGETKSGTAKVEFAFTLPAGETARAVENKFWQKKFSGEISQIFSITRSLKKRISRLSKTAA